MLWLGRFGSKFNPASSQEVLLILVSEVTYAAMHGRAPDELVLMRDWIGDLVVFIIDERYYSYEMAEEDEMNVVTSEGKIEEQKDSRWKELLDLADIFSGSER